MLQCYRVGKNTRRAKLWVWKHGLRLPTCREFRRQQLWFSWPLRWNLTSALKQYWYKDLTIRHEFRFNTLATIRTYHKPEDSWCQIPRLVLDETHMPRCGPRWSCGAWRVAIAPSKVAVPKGTKPRADARRANSEPKRIQKSIWNSQSWQYQKIWTVDCADL